MLECPICRRSYDGSFRVFVPPHHEAFDTVVCARRAAEVWGWDKVGPVPVILPTIEAVNGQSEARVASAAPRRRIAALAALAIAPGHAALATGVGLLAAGTAASIYLSTESTGKTAHPSAVAAGAPHTRQTIGPPPAVPRPSAIGSAKARPAAKATSRAGFVADRGTGRSLGTEPVGGAGTAQLASQSSPPTAPKSSKPSPSTSKSPPATPKPPGPAKPTPPAPPVNPPGPTAPPSGGGGGITTAGNPAPQPVSTTASKSKPKSKPPPAQPPPAQPPPTQPPAPAPTSEEPDSTRPGYGRGDENHDHTGPPGQDDEGDDHHSSGESDDGDGNGRGGGHGRGNGGGNGNGHDHGH